MSSEERREAARVETKRIATEELAQGNATGWFERLYSASAGDPGAIPWVELEPKRFLREWIEAGDSEAPPRDRGEGRKALVVGCGLGDDAAYLHGLGYRVTAFDVAESAVAWARRRFPDPDLDFRVADLFHPPDEWRRAFDLSVEIYTVQALPPEHHQRAAESIADLLAPGGELLVITYSHRDGEEIPAPPWPLRRDELDHFASHGVELAHLEEWSEDDPSRPPRRFRAVFRREN